MSGRAKKPAAPRKKSNGYKMPAPIPNGFVIHDTTMKKKWRIGPSIGVGGFGEIYSACDHEGSPKKGSSYPYVIKIEPHENGPLFVEKHFYIRNCNKDDITKFMKSRKLSSLGMPLYHGNGSVDYNGEKYRYLVLERYGRDLWSVFRECGRRFPTATVFQIGLQMLDVLEYIHSRGYVHADIKGANILLGLKGTESQAHLVDFGLAARVNDKEFKPDPKCAHNGTIEYTSRDAHLGVATMRGDLEILGYNMLQWVAGSLPWEDRLSQPKAVQDAKETFMKNVRKNIVAIGDQVPDALIKFFEYINTLKPKDVPDYTKCRGIFEAYLKGQGKTRSSKLEFTPSPTKTSKKTSKASTEDVSDGASSEKPKKRVKKQNGDATKVKKVKKPVVLAPDSESDGENEEPEVSPSVEKRKKTIKSSNKRKSSEPLLLVKVKKTKLTPKITPPVKRNHVNISTQTSDRRKSPRQVSFDSPICEIIGETKPLKSKSTKNESVNSSGDIFEDSFVIEDKKVKPKRKLLSEKELIVKKVVKKKTVQSKRSWKDLPTVVNGRSPPK